MKSQPEWESGWAAQLIPFVTGDSRRVCRAWSAEKAYRQCHPLRMQAHSLCRDSPGLAALRCLYRFAARHCRVRRMSARECTPGCLTFRSALKSLAALRRVTTWHTCLQRLQAYSMRSNRLASMSSAIAKLQHKIGQMRRIEGHEGKWSFQTAFRNISRS